MAAGSDSSSGAGIQADLKTLAAHGVYGVGAITALVAENPGSVRSIEPVSTAAFRAQLDSCLEGFPVSCVKTGMLATGEIVDSLCDALAAFPDLELVVDPVLRASAGPELLDEAGMAALRSWLLPKASLITPNLPEAEALLGRPIPPDGLPDAARELHELFGCDVLLKGGHAPTEGDEVIDHACLSGEVRPFRHARIPVGDVHGTGCTLASAIAGRRARGESLPEAIEGAIRYLGKALEAHWSWPHPRASAALNHFPDTLESE